MAPKEVIDKMFKRSQKKFIENIKAMFVVNAHLFESFQLASIDINERHSKIIKIL